MGNEMGVLKQGEEEEAQSKSTVWRQEEDKKAESTDELTMMSESEQVRTGRGSAWPRPEGEMRSVGRTRPAEKAKGKATEERVNMDGKARGAGSKGSTCKSRT